MSRRIRPSARKKTLHNVMCSALSETDKKCIEEVFEKFELQKAELEKVKQRADEWHREAELTAEKLDGAINAQETLQKALAEKAAEVERLNDNLINKCIYLSDDETTEYCVDGPCPNFKTEAEIKAEAIKELLDKIEKQAIPNEDDVYWVELDDIYNLVKEMVGDTK
ncbi:MAG: hypothetical protein IKJ41_10905 [Clostridia bacterium]|nr:hypothetical protein [Clostridia bacterium]